MACKATVRQAGDVAVVDLSGRITLGDGSGTLRDTVKSLIGQQRKQILLNLADVTYIDSAGLGEMVGSYATITNQGGEIKLVNPQSKVRDLLQVTKLYTVFESFTDEGTALASFRPRAAAG